MTDQDHPFLHFFSAFFAGGTSASIAVTAVAPLERIKLILQSQAVAANIPEDKRYKGLIDCFKRIPQEQGVLAFWRGNVASVLRCFPYQALNFSLKDLFRSYMAHEDDPLPKRLLANLVSGGLAGACALTVIYPLDLARTKLALDVGRGEGRVYKTVREVLVDTSKRHGIFSIYRGFIFSVCGAFFYRALYFGLYDTIQGSVRNEYQHEIWLEFPAAEFSATTAGFLSYPMDTVRRQMMLQSFKSMDKNKNKEIKFLGVWESTKKLHRKAGIKGFFRGSLTNILRGTGGAIMLVLYDKIDHFLVGDHPILGRFFFQETPPAVPDNRTEISNAKPEIDTSFRSAMKKPCKIFKDRHFFCNF